MSDIDRLITSFENLDNDEANSSDKIELILQLEDAEDARVTDLLLGAAANENEYDLVRIEALKAIRVKSFLPEERQKVTSQLIGVLRTSSDDDVRNYTALALENFTDVNVTIEALLSIIINPDNDTDLRYNAFGALKRGTLSIPLRQAMQSLTNDPEFGKSATRRLLEWDQTQGN